MAVFGRREGVALGLCGGGQSPSVSLLLAPAAAARVMHELAPLRGAGEARTPQTDADDTSRFARTRVPRRFRVALDWDRLPCSLPAPRLRTLCPQPGLPPPTPGASRDWPASPTNGAPPPPPSPAPRLPGQWQRGGRGAPSRGVPAPGPALTPPRTWTPLLPAGQRAAAAPPRRLGASQPLWFSSTPRHPWRSDGGGGQEAPRAGPPLTGHSIRLLPGYSAPRCCAGNPGSSLRVHVPGPGRPAWTSAKSSSPRSCRTCEADLCLRQRSLPKSCSSCLNFECRAKEIGKVLWQSLVGGRGRMAF